MKIGVLALQGAFREHCQMLNACGVEAIEVRTVEDLEKVVGLIIPGGESTTIGKLMQRTGLMQAIYEYGQAGMPIYGSCAGMILLCNHIIDSDQPCLGLIEASVRRNAFGRQKESFEKNLDIDRLGIKLLNAIFIRAPYFEKVGPAATPLAWVEGKAVLVQQQNFLACAFHCELTKDTRLHQFFINLVRQS